MIGFWSEVLLLAILFDLVFGEPPSFIHPVVWMGKMIDFFMQKAPLSHRKIYGLFMVVLCIGTAFIIGYLLSAITGIIGMIIGAYFLKSTFSIRMLLVSAIGIQKDLEIGNIEKVRNDLKTFVGRDTSRLNTHQSASAVIESLAESFVDGILAPLFYFFIFGLPGALAYRMINTLDSMVGYKKEPYVELGYAAAKLDDLANLVPSRLSLPIISAASILFGKPLDSIRTCLNDHNKTASPNSGWSMAAVSGALNIRLEKVGYHVLGNGYRPPELIQIRKTVYLMGFSALIVTGVMLSMEKIPLVQF